MTPASGGTRPGAPPKPQNPMTLLVLASPKPSCPAPSTPHIGKAKILDHNYLLLF